MHQRPVRAERIAERQQVVHGAVIARREKQPQSNKFYQDSDCNRKGNKRKKNRTRIVSAKHKRGF
jgi:hypothetical protein